MATYVNWFGHINADGFAKDIKNMSYAKAYKEFVDAFNEVDRGIGGFTKNDANNLIAMANALTAQYGAGVNTKNLVGQLQQVINKGSYDNSVMRNSLKWDIDSLSPQNLTGSSTGEITKDSNGQAVVTKGSKTGTNLATGQKATTSSNTKTSTSTGGSSGGGGGYSGGGSYGSGSVNNSYYEKLIKEYRDKIDALEHPKVWTASELAEKHGVQDQYDYDKILQMYNDKTNKYYQDAVANQLSNNANAERSNSVFANSLINNYLSGYNNAAPTAVGKGTRAANALSSNIYADMTNEEASSNLQSIVNTYLEKQKDELANNPILARQQYNDMGKLLLQLGANYNTSEVQNYINELNAYDTAYAGIRNAQNNLASTAAAAYQNNASAALANNTYNNNNAMAKYYKAYYGTENNNWQKAYQNMLRDQAISTDVNTSAN